MNLVGPRPHPTSNHAVFMERIAYYGLRFQRAPGRDRLGAGALRLRQQPRRGNGKDAVRPVLHQEPVALAGRANSARDGRHLSSAVRARARCGIRRRVEANSCRRPRGVSLRTRGVSPRKWPTFRCSPAGLGRVIHRSFITRVGRALPDRRFAGVQRTRPCVCQFNATRHRARPAGCHCSALRFSRRTVVAGATSFPCTRGSAAGQQRCVRRAGGVHRHPAAVAAVVVSALKVVRIAFLAAGLAMAAHVIERTARHRIRDAVFARNRYRADAPRLVGPDAPALSLAGRQRARSDRPLPEGHRVLLAAGHDCHDHRTASASWRGR